MPRPSQPRARAGKPSAEGLPLRDELGEQLADWGKVIRLETRGRTSGRSVEVALGYVEEPDGSENLVGALRQSMAALGARTIAEMQRAELVYAPSVQTEGKSWQRRG